MFDTVKNDKVVAAFARGERAISHTGNLSSDGRELLSYGAKIAHRTSGGLVVVGDFTSPGGCFHSVTTSTHVNKAKRHANEVMHPTVFRNSAPLWPA